MPCHIMGLPSELRAQIFEYTIPEGALSPSRSKKYGTAFALLQVNREFNAEVNRILFHSKLRPFEVAIVDDAIGLLGNTYYWTLPDRYRVSTLTPHVVKISQHGLYRVSHLRLRLITHICNDEAISQDRVMKGMTSLFFFVNCLTR